MTTTITTIWSDLRGDEVRHTRIIDSHVALCGLAVEHTRNYMKHASTGHDVRCETCALAVARINAENAWRWPDQHAQFVQAQRAEFDIDERRIDSANFPADKEGF